jgi:hypothetical protein
MNDVLSRRSSSASEGSAPSHDGESPSIFEHTFRSYDESLLRQVAAKLIKPRNHWPVEELIARCCAGLENVALIDRRLKELSQAERRLLALMGHSGQSRWQVVHLIEMSLTLGDQDGVETVWNLLESGLLMPELLANAKRLRGFNQWLGQSGQSPSIVFTNGTVIRRALGADLGIPALSSRSDVESGIHEADGLEWPLRLAALWQMASSDPLRRTQQADFFKRDQDRLQNNALLNSAPADSPFGSSGMPFWLAELALAMGILHEADSEWRAAELPSTWDQGLLPTLASLWSAMPLLKDWPEEDGLRRPIGASFFLLLIALLSRCPEGKWINPRLLQDWLLQRHPRWKGGLAHPSRAVPDLTPADTVLEVAYQLRMIQAAKDKNGEWLVRLSPIGRWLLGVGLKPNLGTLPGQTLLVQPNLEIVAYRQGLTPSLITGLSHFAAWKSLGAACLLQLQPETVYHALEGGYDFNRIQQTLSQHSTRPIPPAVLDLLRTWTAKRDRLSLYPSATLLEFDRPEDLDDALARGLQATRLSERLAVVAKETLIDYRHFRLSGTRDYGLPPEKCVDLEPDGVTLTIDPERSDLLVETELRRFARYLDHPLSNGRRQYRVNFDSLGDSENGGLGMFALEEWFQQRTGRPLSPAIRLLMTAKFQPAAEMKNQLVFHVPSAYVADGLMQLSETRGLIEARLGPTTLAVAPDKSAELSRLVEQWGLAVLHAVNQPSGNSPTN